MPPPNMRSTSRHAVALNRVGSQPRDPLQMASERGCRIDVPVRDFESILDFGPNSVQLATTCESFWQLRSVETSTRIVIVPIRNDVGVDVHVAATSKRCRTHDLTARVCSVWGCLGRHQTTWRFCILLSMFCVLLWRDRWPFHNNSKSSQLPALRLRSCEGGAHPYGTGASSAAKHSQHFTARGCSQLREHPAARPASNVTGRGMPILISLCMMSGEFLIFGPN